MRLPPGFEVSVRRSVTRVSIVLLALAIAGPVELLDVARVSAAEPGPAASHTPSPSPDPSPSPTPAASPSPTPEPDPEPTPAASPVPSPTPDATPSPGPSPSPTPDPSPTADPSPTPQPSPTPSPTPNPSPTPVPFGAFTTPAAGAEVTGVPGPTTVAWTESIPVASRALRQYYAAPIAGSCQGATWSRAWTRAVASRGATVRNLVAGVCYRYTVTAVAAGTGQTSVITSGVVRIPGAWTGRFDLYRSAAFSTQRTWYWCVPASVQMMLNLIKGTSDHSWTNQNTYYRYGRPRRHLLNSSRGLDPKSWMLTLNRYGGADYRIVTSSNLWLLMRYAARRNRLTGKPVGLLVARGGHAWVMTGFKATRDPALTGDYTLTSIRTMGPLWPMQRYRNGYFDAPPGAWFTMGTVSAFYGRYRDDMGRTPWDGKYVIISP